MRRPDRTSGLRPVPEPPAEADALGVALHYLMEIEREFARARLVVKSRASFVVVVNGALTAAVALIGATMSVTGWRWLGVLSAGVAGLIGVIAAWDGLFRHRQLWVQRSQVLSELQSLRRRTMFDVASGSDRAEVATRCQTELEAILGRDMEAWTEMRRRVTQTPLSGDSNGVSQTSAETA